MFRAKNKVVCGHGPAMGEKDSIKQSRRHRIAFGRGAKPGQWPLNVGAEGNRLAFFPNWQCHRLS